MILTCPECATGYFVDDAKIRPGGRTVRCAACGARWTAVAESPLELVSSPEEGAVARETPPPLPKEDEPLSALTGDDLPRAFRSRATNDKKVRQAAVTGAIWAGMAVLLLLVVGLAIVFRVDVVRVWPSTAATYAAIGLPVNRVGLTIEGVKAEPSLQQGHAALLVTGVIRNVEDHEVTSPPIRISLFNAQHRRVAGQIATPADPKIPSGETRRFSTAILDPPFSAQDLEVAFVTDGKSPAVTKTAPAAAPVAAPLPPLRGAAAPAPAAPANAALSNTVTP